MSEFPAGIIQQVDRDGNQAQFSNIAPPEVKEPTPPPRRKTPWSFKNLFCGCFSPQIDSHPSQLRRDALQDQHRGENGVDMQVANSHVLLQEGGISNVSFNPSEEGYLLPEKCIPHKITLILDLDETLVHSSFKPVANADFVVPVEVDGTVHRVFVCKRPGVDEFMKKVGEMFEVVVFTASLDKYANPVLDLLDRTNSVHYRLFREACVMNEGSLVKDLTRLGRDVKKCIIVDNSPMSYMLQPENAVPISSWFDDPQDDQLYTLLPWFVGIAQAEDVLPGLDDLRHQMNLDGGNYTGVYKSGSNGPAHSADENEYAINEFIDHESSHPDDPLLSHGQL